MRKIVVFALITLLAACGQDAPLSPDGGGDLVPAAKPDNPGKGNGNGGGGGGGGDDDGGGDDGGTAGESPTASFYYLCTLNECLLRATAEDPDGGDVTFEWDFGHDGETATGDYVNNHVFPWDPENTRADYQEDIANLVNENVASYTVILTATDDEGDATTHEQLIYIPNEAAGQITLTAKGGLKSGKELRAKLSWTPLSPEVDITEVDIWKDGQKIATVDNVDDPGQVGYYAIYYDRFEKSSKGKQMEWHAYQVCEAGADPANAVRKWASEGDEICSNESVAAW